MKKKTMKTDPATPMAERSNKKVFVVHGHDHELKSDVEVFLNNIGLEPITLHRQVDEGLTIIEKFEKHATLTSPSSGYSR